MTLNEQIAKIQANISKLEAEIKAGNYGEAFTYVMERGKRRAVGRNEYFLNLNRTALAQRQERLKAQA